jgi:hypothetical protein
MNNARVALTVVLAATALACQDPVLERIDKIEKALSSTNRCDVEPVAGVIADSGTEEQRKRAEDAQTVCDARRTGQRCDVLASHIDVNAVTPDDLAWMAMAATSRNAGATTRDVIGRVTSHQVSAADLGLSRSDLLCEPKIWDRLVAALAMAPTAWSLGSVGAVPIVSDDMRGALARTSLNADVQGTIQADEDLIARPVLLKTETGDMAFAEAFCELGTVLRVAPAASCVALAGHYAHAKAMEDAAEQRLVAQREAAERREAAQKAALEARENAAAQAKEAQCQAIDIALNSCLFPCLDLDLFDPRSDACQGACNRRFPKTGCE